MVISSVLLCLIFFIYDLLGMCLCCVPLKVVGAHVIVLCNFSFFAGLKRGVCARHALLLRVWDFNNNLVEGVVSEQSLYLKLRREN